MFRQFAYKASLKLCVVVLTNSPSPGAKQGGRGGGMHRHKTVTAWADGHAKANERCTAKTSLRQTRQTKPKYLPSV